MFRMLVCLWALAVSGTAIAGTVERAAFGKLSDGKPVEAVTLTNAHGVRATILTYGATVQSLYAPDRNGKPANIVLGYATMPEYERGGVMMGATIGRIANRIADGTFMLDGKRYELPTVNGRRASSHGGARGFDKAVWQVREARGGPGSATLMLRHVSPDGDQGFPGTLTIDATFTLDDRNQLTIAYRATSDAPTVVALTSHNYFNMAGEGTPGGAMTNELTLHADKFTPVDERGVPTGELRAVAGSVFDFRQPHRVDARVRNATEEQIRFGRGYDHNYVIDGTPGTLRPAARLVDPASGRQLDLLTDQPGLQVYSSGFFDGRQMGISGHAYWQGDGLALEPQNFPNAVNEPRFPSARLDAGKEYRNVIVLRLSTAPRR